MNKFYIDLTYVCSISITAEIRISRREDESEEDFIIRKLKNNDVIMTSFGTEDHPEFTKLREMLGAQGYIEIERRWWNGDQVLKTFYLNDKKFKEGDQFASAAAMHYTLGHQ